MSPNPAIWPHLLNKSLMKNLIFCAVRTMSTIKILDQHSWKTLNRYFPTKNLAVIFM